MRRVKLKKVKMTLGQDDVLADMFNQMIGAGQVNLTIVYPRYLRIKSLCEQLIKLFELVTATPFIRNSPEFSHQRNEINRFCESARAEHSTLFHIDLSEYEWNLTLVEDELHTKFSEAYEIAKKSNLVNTFIVMCDRLVKYKRHFIDINNPNPKFLTTMAGTEWCPFPFTSLNIKYIFILIGISCVLGFCFVISTI